MTPYRKPEANPAITRSLALVAIKRQASDRTTAELHQAIKEAAVSVGASLRDVAQVSGLSHETVRQIAATCVVPGCPRQDTEITHEGPSALPRRLCPGHWALRRQF